MAETVAVAEPGVAVESWPPADGWQQTEHVVEVTREHPPAMRHTITWTRTFLRGDVYCEERVQRVTHWWTGQRPNVGRWPELEPFPRFGDP